SVLLTQTNLATRLPLDQVRAICLDADWEQIAQEGAEAPACHVLPDHLAYIIYTSGSTGQPKGVEISQRALVNHALILKQVFEQGSIARVLQFISLNFDAAAEEIFPPLISGAALILRGAVTELTTDQMAQFCEQYHITVLHLPVSFWHQWVDVMAANRWQMSVPLEVLMVGGEQPAVEKLHSWLVLTDRPVHFINAYGPTEATITTTLYETTYDEKTLPASFRIPIGHPIANRRVYVLDQNLQLVPLGVPGELWIGGVGVARGYLRQAGLTAERFLPDPFSEALGARMYRTGDWVRYLPDGNLEFLGRQDQQVKLRGFRIELGEIEAALAAWPEVREAVVVAREDLPGDKRLVAYLVPQAGQRLAEPPELRQQLLQCLPDYMVPANFIVLESLP
ncbi:hypothetical protein ARNL5_02802, partial [Anaerolineae bacterium]